MNQDILYNVTGQTVYLDCPEGRPSSVTSATVYPMTTGDDGTSESALGTPAVETNPNTTFDATSGLGETNPNLCNLAATTGIAIGRIYLATNAASESEWVEVKEISSGASVTTRHPLENAYASADSFVSTRITATVDSTWVADKTNITDDLDPNPGYRVRWVYVVNSTTYVRDTYFDLVRYKGQHNVRALDVDAVVPGWIDALPNEHREDRGQRLIDAAYTSAKCDMMEATAADELIRHREVIDELVKYKAVLKAEEAKVILGATQNPLSLEVAERNYNRLFDGLIRITHKTAQSVDSTGAGARPLAAGIRSR